MSRFRAVRNAAAGGHRPDARVAGAGRDADPARLPRGQPRCEFRSGIYRVHDSRSASVFESVIQMHPGWSGRVLPFGFDSLGRQFALDVDEGKAEVLMFEPGTGEVREVPCIFADFHDRELVDQAEAALAESFFEEWVEVSGKGVPWAACAGYKVPLFLGSADVVENLEVSDVEVCWSSCVQLWPGVGGDSREAW